MDILCLATVIKATVLGIDGPKMARRAIERIVENPKLGPFNALQIEATAIGSGRFPTIRYITVRPRHIQQNLFLFQAQTRRKMALPGEHRRPRTAC